MVNLEKQKLVEYAYTLGNLNKAAIFNEKLTTSEIQDLWDIQEALGLSELQFNTKEEVLNDISECYIQLIIRADKDG